MVFSWTYGFHDGAVIGDAPDRKPTEKKIKQDGLHIDEDWVFRETLEPDGKATACKAVSSGFDSHRRLSVNAATALMFQSCSLWTLPDCGLAAAGGFHFLRVVHRLRRCRLPANGEW